MSDLRGLPAVEFDEPLLEGVIVRRKSRFTMEVELENQVRSLHCPTTGRIGSIDVAGRLCLVSPAHGQGRRTAGTVEALSLARPETEVKEWIGINQNAANRYVEHYLRCGGLAEAVGGEPGRPRADVRREASLSSRPPWTAAWYGVSRSGRRISASRRTACPLSESHPWPSEPNGGRHRRDDTSQVRC